MTRSLTRFKEYVATTVIKTGNPDKRSVLSGIQVDREQTKRARVEESARKAAEEKEPSFSPMAEAQDSDSGSSGFELYG